MDELLSIKQAAGVLACSEALLRKWLSRRAIPRVKVGRLTRIRRSDLESWVRHGIRPAAKGSL
jgi:excisionase family DNA binding protein